MIEKKLDLLAVGDVVTDNFIKLFDQDERVEKRPDGSWLAIPFGTKLPFDFAETVEGVGNAANAAVACSRLGLSSGLASNVGDDQYGRDIIASHHKNGVDTRFIHINPGKKSNYHYVLWYKAERTILIKHEEYDYRWPRFRISDLPAWVYFSSVSEHAKDYHDAIAEWLEAHPTIKMAFNPGTFQLEMGPHRLKRIYARTEVLSVNREEATTISGGDHGDIHDLLNRLHALGPRIVVISDGPSGAYASDGEHRFKMPIYPDPRPPYDRTGAGDAFSSTFTAALVRGASIEEALLLAPINAMSVVQKVGAQAGLLTMSEINHLLREAPASYHSEKI